MRAEIIRQIDSGARQRAGGDIVIDIAGSRADMRLQIEYETERSARRDKFVSAFIGQLHGWFIAQLIVPALRL